MAEEERVRALQLRSSRVAPSATWRHMGNSKRFHSFQGKRKNPDLQAFSHALHAKADYSCKTWLVDSTAGVLSAASLIPCLILSVMISVTALGKNFP